MKTSLSMKILAFFLLTSLFFQFKIYAQTNIFPTTGKMGLGTVTPASQLEIVAPAITGGEKLIKMRVADAVDDYLEIRNTTAGTGVFMPLITGNVVSTTNSSLYLIGQTDSIMDTGTFPLMFFSSRKASEKINNRPLFGWANFNVRCMTMLANGNLGVGTDNPTEKLAVKGKIRAQEIKVETADWPDYVFAKGYQLPSLQETEKHIKEKGHLPGIPSAEEVKANGVDLGAMNAKLLKKIEELTLYLIEIKRDNEREKLKASEQKQIINQQQKDIAELKSKLK